VDLKRISPFILPSLMGLALIIVIIGSFIAKDIFWDGFVWKYYWGPIVADAGGDAKGLTSSYNWIDTLTYGLVLAMSAYYIHKLFVKLNLRVGLDFFLALSPILLIGPSARVLEDMELFNEPLQYIFISPIIYIFLGITTLITILLFYRLETRFRKGGKWFDRGTFTILMLPGLFTLMVTEGFPDWLNLNVPIWPILIGSPLLAFLYTRYRRSTKWEGGVGAFWTQILLIVVYMYVMWFIDDGWLSHYRSLGNSEPETALLGGSLVLFLVFFSTVLVFTGLYLMAKKYDRWKNLVKGVNIMIVGGHMLDASATFIGIDRYGYVEKHILPKTLMNMTGTAAIMYPLNLIFLIPALYIMDVSMEEETKENPHLMALVKLTILILGFAPGTRDIIRMALGV
jgi:uncharacterized membrane protein